MSADDASRHVQAKRGGAVAVTSRQNAAVDGHRFRQIAGTDTSLGIPMEGWERVLETGLRIEHHRFFAARSARYIRD